MSVRPRCSVFGNDRTPNTGTTWRGYRPWTGDVELDVVELGDRVATTYDEAHEVAYRIGEALGLRRCDVPLGWQWVFQRVGRSYHRDWRHSER